MMFDINDDYSDNDDFSGDDECDMMYEEGDCMSTMADAPEEMLELFDSCWYSLEIDSCTGEDVYCWMEIGFDGETYEGFCDTIEEWFSPDGDNFECEEGESRLVEEVGDCKAAMEMDGHHVEGLDWCEYTVVYDECSGEEMECNAIAMWWDETVTGSCDELIEMFEYEESYEDNYSDDDDFCEEIEEEGDCKAMLEAEGHLVDGLEWCEYNSVWDSCTGEDLWCNAAASHHGELIEGTCDEILDYFGIHSDDDDDECIIEEEGDCIEVAEYIEGMTECSYYSVWD